MTARCPAAEPTDGRTPPGEWLRRHGLPENYGD